MQEQTHQLQKINFWKPKPKPEISKVKSEIREKFLYLISSGHRSNEGCRNHRSEQASERKRGSYDGERGTLKELRRAEGVEPERVRERKSFQVLKVLRRGNIFLHFKWNSSLEETSFQLELDSSKDEFQF